MFGRTLRSNLAIDNGRSAEFIRRKSYPDKSRCYECGEDGHLSYKCPKNALGERDPPPKKDKRRKKENSKAEKNQVCSFMCLVTVSSIFPEHLSFECIKLHLQTFPLQHVILVQQSLLLVLVMPYSILAYYYYCAATSTTGQSSNSRIASHCEL
jgi:hypothetical protein